MLVNSRILVVLVVIIISVSNHRVSVSWKPNFFTKLLTSSWWYAKNNRNCNFQISKAPLKSQAHGTSLFTSAASNQKVCPKDGPWDAQLRL